MNILVVDDSIVYRSAIKSALETMEFVKKIQVASNGKIALDFMKSSHFDVVTLDMEMPQMDGLETIEKIRAFNKDVGIIMFASPTANQAHKTMKALELGANEFVHKVEGTSGQEDGVELIKRELLPRVKAFKDIRRGHATLKRASENPEVFEPKARSRLLEDLKQKKFAPYGVFLGSSTGGPDLWRKIFGLLDGVKLQTPLFLAQHMPAVFTKQFANMLNNMVPFTVKEAQDGEKVAPGTCYVAPGDFHMVLKRKDGGVHVSLNQEPKVCYVRPAVDCLFDSITEVYGKNALAIILTGMGEDGLASCRKLKSAGVPVIAQDKETSAVWGMPGAVVKAELADAVVPGLQVAEILKSVG